MLFADYGLARRLERAEAVGCAAYTDADAALRPEGGAASLMIGGGCAAFHRAGSPLTQAVGLGMDGPVTAADLEAVETFYRSKGSPAIIHLCPLADPTLAELTSRRGYRITEFNTVLVRRVQYGELIPPPAPGVSVRPARADEADKWSRLMLHGFLGRAELTVAEGEIGKAIFHSATGWIAESAGEAMGAAGLSVHEGLGCFFADSTLPQARNRGVHTALIRGRLRRVQERGCDMATASAQPGTISQHNYEMCGFRVAYTKVIVALG